MIKKIFLFLAAGFTPVLCAAVMQGDWDKDFYSRFLQAVSYERDGQNMEAAKIYVTLLNDAPDSAVLKEELVRLSLIMDDSLGIDAIIEDLPAIGTAKAYALYAAYSWNKMNLRKADEYYLKALELEPANANILAQYITLLTKIDHLRAVEYLENLAGTDAESAPAYYSEIAKIYYTKQDAAKAVAALDKATSLMPSFSLPYIMRAEIYQQSGNFVLVEKEYKELIAQGHTSGGNYEKLGSVNILLGKMSEAEKYFKLALEKDPSAFASNKFMAALEEEKRNYKAAAQYLENIEGFDSKADLQLQAALNYSRINDKERAAQLLHSAYQNSGGSVEVGYFYALSLLDAKNNKEALKILKEILDQSPDYTRVNIMYAYVLLEEGKNKEFNRVIKELYLKNPDNAEVLNMYAFCLADNNKDLDKAYTLAVRALELRPGSAAYTDTLGWVYYKQKNYPAAIEHLQAALAKTPHDKEILLHLGIAYLDSGDAENARKYLQQSGEENFNKYKKKLEKLENKTAKK